MHTLDLPLLVFGWSSREKLSVAVIDEFSLIASECVTKTHRPSSSVTPSVCRRCLSSVTLCHPGVCPILRYVCLTLESELPESGILFQFSLLDQRQAQCLLHSVP